MENMKLVDKAIKLAKRKRINQSELARLIGTPPSRLSEWKNDNGKPSIEFALRMARVVGVPLDYLADDEQDDPPPPSLTPDEHSVVELYRAIGINKREALRRLSTAFEPSAPLGNPEAWVPGAVRDHTDFLKPKPVRRASSERGREGKNQDDDGGTAIPRRKK